MNKKTMIAFPMVALLAACASVPPAGLAAGKMVSYDCEGRDFSARIEEDGSSVRVRGPEGSFNLASKGEGKFEGDGWALVTSGADGIALIHNNKVIGKNCKKSA